MQKKLAMQFLEFAPNPRIDVAVYREPDQDDIQQHEHSFVEIVYITGGKAIHETRGLRHPLKRGDVLVIPGNRTHAYRKTKRFSIINVLIRERIIAAFAEQLSSLPGYHALFGLTPFQAQHGRYAQHLHLNPETFNEALVWINRIENLTHGSTALHRFGAHAWLQLLIGQLVEACGGTIENTGNPTSGIALTLAHLDSSVNEKISIPALARLAGMSERTFLRRFREATGHSPIEYHIRCRVRHAERLLTKTDYPITRIAGMSGFDDSNYFSRQFRRIHGLTPRQWRKANSV